MKKSKITSILTALTLTALSLMPVNSSAITIDEVPEISAELITSCCGENTYIEKADGDIYYCLSPQKIAVCKVKTPYMSVTLKKSSVLDLNEIVSSFGAVCTGTDENGIYIISPSDNLQASRETLMNEIYPKIAENLSKYPDVLDVEENCWAGTDYNLDYAKINVKNTVLNEEDFPNFVIIKNDDGSLTLIHKQYYKTLSEDYTGRKISVNYYYSELYETYMSLIDKYGDENLSLEFPEKDYSDLENSIGTSKTLYHFIEPVPHTGFLNDIISYFEDKDAYVEISDDDKEVSVITEYSADIYEKSISALYITVKKGTTLNPEEAGLSNYSNVEKINDTVYWIKNSFNCNSDNIKKCDNIVSVDIGYEITRIDFSVAELIIKTNMTDEEMNEKYPDIKKYESYYLYNGDNLYKQLKELEKDEKISKIELLKEIPTIIPPSFAPALDEEYIKNLYTAEIKGDVNADGDVDIADSVTISAYVANSASNPIKVDQRIVNGDVHNTGDGLTANDALMIQQYLAGEIDSL